MHLSIFLTTHVISINTTMHIMAYNGSQVNIDDICRNWQPLSSACFASWVAKQAMTGNGRKKVHRGYLVGNGFRALYAPFPYYFGYWL